MTRRTTGTLLLFIAALLYSTRYLAAAVFGSSLANWSAELFNAMLEYVGQELVTWSVIALLTGLIYLAWAELETFLHARAKK
jgi:hypothetical protein